MNIGKEIALEAKKYKLCGPWYIKMLQVTTYKQLAEMYFDGDDWSMEKDFPGLELLRKHKGAISFYGMFVDENKILQNLLRAAFFGDSMAEISYDNYSVGNIIVRHKANVKIKAKDNTKVFINLLDSAKIEVEASGNSEVIIYKYSSLSECKISGNVLIKKSSWER